MHFFCLVTAVEMKMGLITKPYAWGTVDCPPKMSSHKLTLLLLSVSQRVCCIWIFYKSSFTSQSILYVDDAPNLSCWKRHFTDLLGLCVSTCSTQLMFSGVLTAFLLLTTPFLLPINSPVCRRPVRCFPALKFHSEFTLNCHNTNSFVQSFF